MRFCAAWCAASLFFGAAAHGVIPGVTRTEHTVEKDNRVVKDRLDPQKNPHHEDDAFLNAVGAVWSHRIDATASGYDASTGHDASTGFLIDRCHVLTNLHVAYTDDVVVNPPPGREVAFGVGQTGSEKDRGALQGLKFLHRGVVVARGDTIILGHVVHNPAADWAVIRLTQNVDGTIDPMTLSAIDPAKFPATFRPAAAGFPTDHRKLRGDGFKLKDLWGSSGRIVGIDPVGGGALMQTTIQTTFGNSGGPIYGDLDGRRHIVVGMVQSIRGNGIDTSESMPNTQILFTPATLAQIEEARNSTPCPNGVAGSAAEDAGNPPRP